MYRKEIILTQEDVKNKAYQVKIQTTNASKSSEIGSSQVDQSEKDVGTSDLNSMIEDAITMIESKRYVRGMKATNPST